MFMTKKARGLTLVELLVVIAIVGVLAGLLLPAVQAAREAVRRMTCQNHSRQIGLALHHHHDTHQVLPSGWLSANRDGDPGWGWAAMILPFVEQQTLEANAGPEFRRRGQGAGGPPISDPRYQRFRETPVPLFLCPSDANEETFTLQRGNGPGGNGLGGPPMFVVARANYTGVFGSRTVEDSPGAGDGAFFQNSSVRFADIRDGLSNTLLVGERCSRLGFATWVGAVPKAYRSAARVVGRTGSVPNHVLNDLADFSSYHPFGANFVLADGSTRMISDEVDLAVYRALFDPRRGRTGRVAAVRQIS